MLLSLLQAGETLSMPQARLLPMIGPRCGELRIRDAEHNWPIIYRLDSDAVIVVEVFAKKTERTPDEIISQCKRRLRQYDQATRDAERG